MGQFHGTPAGVIAFFIMILFLIANVKKVRWSYQALLVLLFFVFYMIEFAIRQNWSVFAKFHL